MMIDVPDHVEHPDAYVAAANARIRANAVKGKRQRFLANPENAALIDRLMDRLYERHVCGENGSDCESYTCPGACGREWRKQRKGQSQFLWKMEGAYHEWGSLTAGQVAAVKRALDQSDERDAKRVQEHEALVAQSKHVGVEGERRDFVLSIDRSFYIRTDTYGYGASSQDIYGNIMHDCDGNVFVYFGKKLGDKGQAVRGKATVKRHDERDGVKQTVISRPKFEVIDYGQDDHSTDDIVDDIQAAGAQ